MTENFPAQPAPAPPVGVLKRWQTWAAAGLVVLVTGGAAVLGASAVDPTDSDQYRSLSGEFDSVSGELDDRTAEVDRLHEQVRRLGEQAEEARSQGVEAAASAAARAAELDAQAAELATREAAVAATEQVIAQSSIGAGTYVVGVDMQPGTYRPQNAVSSDCYWSITVSGTNGSDIVDNDIPGGGFPTVTVSSGQDFNSRRCGTWVRQ